MTPDELKRIIATIVEAVAAAADRPVLRCQCHGVRSECCPDRLRGVLGAGATRLGVHAAGGAPAGIAGMIDHTLLKPDATRGDIEELCREAAQFQFATVCVNPIWAALAAARLSTTAVRVCSVVGFPLGATTADVKGYETRRARSARNMNAPFSTATRWRSSGTSRRISVAISTTRLWI